MPPTSQDNFFKDHMNVFAYYAKQNQKVAAINLWFNGYRILHGATIVKKFEVYKNMPTGPDNPPDLDLVMFFWEDNIMDKTRIVTCYENFMKGILLLNDVVVHKLVKASNELKKAQRGLPVTINEVFTPQSFMQFDASKPKSWETSFQTINFSWMLEPAYQKIINLPPDVLELIRSINEERNKLHFMSIGEFQFGDSTIEKYGRIIEFADTVIKKCILDLDGNIKGLLENMTAGK
jgi:hypothetical protein